ncbi:MAG: hypothetical protein KAS32_05150 [Candidatus Peribacteraceae bacterium]|nr:hypothetical protein [Candidatus Peribacteraceae bacterium]
MTDKVAVLLEICTKLVETAAILKIVDLQYDATHSSERVGHPQLGYEFTGYGTVTLKVTFEPPETPKIQTVSEALYEANPFRPERLRDAE